MVAGVTTLHQCVICDDIFSEYENLVTHNQTHVKTEESMVNTSSACPTTNVDIPITKESFKEANLPFSSCPITNDDTKISVSFDVYPKSFVETDAPFKHENDSADINTHLTDDIQLLQKDYSRNMKNSANASSDVGLENVLQMSNELNIDKFSNKTGNEFDKNSSDKYCKEEWLNVAVKVEQVDKDEPIRNHVGLLHSCRDVCIQNRAINIEKKDLFIQNCDSNSEKKDLSIQNCDSISEKKDLSIQNCVLKYNITNNSDQSLESNHDIKDEFIQRQVLDIHKKYYSVQNCVSNCKNTGYSLPNCAGVLRSDIDRKNHIIQHSETEEKRGKYKAVQIKQENREEFLPGEDKNQSKKCREYKAVYIKAEVCFQCKSCHKVFENGKDALKHHGVTQPNDFIKSVEFPQENTNVLPESLIISQEKTDGIADRLTIPQKICDGTADRVVISQKNFDRIPNPQKNFHGIRNSLMKYEENVDENPEHLVKYEKVVDGNVDSLKENADGNPDILKENTAVSQDILRTRMKNEDGIVKHCVQIQTVEMNFSEGNENSLSNDFNQSKNRGNKAFNQENGKRLKTRQRSIEDKRSFTCEQCGRNFTTLYHLKNHEKSHQREKRVFMCDMCGKHFQCVSAMETHRRTHTKEKPYPCTVCTKKFGTKGQLLSHTRTHTGEKPYNCEFCGKTFITSSNQQKHVRIHTGEKPYMCGACDKTFSNSGDLRRHVRCHTGEKPFKCHVCQKDFAQKSNLRKHSKIHTGVKTHVCHICEKAFLEHWNLTKHIKIHTRNQTRSEKQSSPSSESKSRATRNIKKGRQSQY